MASLLGNPSAHFGDSLVGQVLPRVYVSRHHAGLSGSTIPSLQTVIRRDATVVAPFVLSCERQATGVATGTLLSLVDTAPHLTTNSVAKKSNFDVTKATGKRKASNYYNTAIRRQQCRANQARYRDRQRSAQLHLEKSVKELHQEVGSLKRRFRDLSSQERSNQSPWSIVAEVFRLVETSFRSPWRMSSAQEMKHHSETRQISAVLERSFTHDTTMGDLVGVDALMEQLRCYTQYFGEPQLKLQRIESTTPSVMSATASLSVTVTEITLRNLFPHLMKQRNDNSNERRRSLYDNLLGQRLQIGCSMSFLFDEGSCRVVRLETQIDLVTALLRTLGNLKDVSEVLEYALITSDGVVGGTHD